LESGGISRTRYRAGGRNLPGPNSTNFWFL
jgi:hypothetical protein